MHDFKISFNKKKSKNLGLGSLSYLALTTENLHNRNSIIMRTFMWDILTSLVNDWRGPLFITKIFSSRKSVLTYKKWRNICKWKFTIKSFQMLSVT